MTRAVREPMLPQVRRRRLAEIVLMAAALLIGLFGLLAWLAVATA